jgi:hypothetical protein
MSADRPLRIALLANALFASGAGLVMLSTPSTVTGVLGVDVPLLPLLAIGLIGFGIDLLHQATRARVLTWRAAYATGLDLVWVGATAVVLSTMASTFAPAGAVLIASVGGAVLGFALWQAWGIDFAHRVPGTRLRHHCVSALVDQPAGPMWSVIADLGAIQRYMPSLAHSKIESGTEPGVGAVRTCIDRKGRSWSEECVAFEPGAFALRFRTEDAAFPFPASEMYGGWTVEPCETGGSRVTVWWTLLPRPFGLAVLLMPIFGLRADREITNVVRRMAAAADTRSDVRGHAVLAAPRVRVLERPCHPPVGVDHARSQLAPRNP